MLRGIAGPLDRVGFRLCDDVRGGVRLCFRRVSCIALTRATAKDGRRVTPVYTVSVGFRELQRLDLNLRLRPFMCLRATACEFTDLKTGSPSRDS